jgi:type I restriction enzyme S subunit
MDLRYAFHLLTHLRLGTLDQSTAIPSLSRDNYSELIVPIADEELQTRLAARIDTLFAEIDEGEAALAEARAGVETYRQALLKAAVTGELTAEWRRDNPPQETGEQLLQRILADRRARWHADPKNARKKYIEPAGPDTDGLPELPDGWAWARVAQLGDVVTGGTPPAADKSAFDGDIPFFTPTDLNAGYGLTQSSRTISEAALGKLRPIPAFSVLVTCIGTVGKTGLTLVSGATNQQINAICTYTPEHADYLFAYFNGPVGQSLVIGNASATTLPIINKGDFSALPVPIPAPEEMLEINRLLAASRAGEAERIRLLNDAAVAASALRQSILTAAFRGELGA